MVTPITFGTTTAGLDPNSVSAAELYSRVSKSLLAKNAGVQKLGAALASDQTRLSGLGQLQSALAGFQALTQSVAGVGLQTGATASQPAVLSALTTGSAKVGSYAVEVKQLAQAQVLAARPQKDQAAAIGSGAATTIKVEFGTTAGSSFAPRTAKTITIDSGNNSLQGIAAAFKSAGVDARIVKGGAGYTLQLGGDTGSANSLRISVGGDATLQKLLSYNPAGLKGLSETAGAQDAQLTIDGKAVTSASNVVTGQIGGTALALSAKGATQVVVAQDSSAIAGNVANFVKGYNDLAAQLATLKQGALKADPALAQAQDQLAQVVKGSGSALAKAGVTRGQNGQLQIDSKALNGAIGADPDAVSALFTGGGKGVADQLSARIGQLIGANGAIGKQK
ncbi:MAG TPA: flagellar filament capping protein FliD, partial [Telluria sp.]|nr:flagellar filament capping protein FliD [Telluria sp.]